MCKTQIRITGAGGQGVILAGEALCESAVNEGLHAIQKGTYTSQVRGGATLVDILIDKEEIFYPYTIPGEIGFMLSTANVSFNRFKDAIRIGGTIVIDPNLVFPTTDDRKSWKFIEIPIVEIAKNEIGVLATQSTLALAITVEITGCVSSESALSVMLSKTPKKYREVNERAFHLGVLYAKKALGKSS